LGKYVEQAEVDLNWVGIEYEGGVCGYEKKYCGVIRVQNTEYRAE
jgi:hypothetical protein